MADKREGLVKLLDSLGESAQFAAYGSLPPVLAGLEVEGVGTVGTPISAADAKRLIAAAEQAPYGRGEQTIVDRKVRRVWQIEPSKVRLRNAAWADHLAAILADVRRELGIAQQVNAELYKLLIYEKGSFFAPHRDTEKTPGMFATLVVGLPSRHQGGRLIVRHDGQARNIDFANEHAEFTTQYAAFYADCQHEIEPVTSGYRVCLVYNLALAGKKTQPSPPKTARAAETAAQLLADVFAGSSDELDKIAIPCTHQYTEAGIDPRQLKGADRARADVLARAAGALGYRCFIALLTHWQSGDVDYGTWDFDDGYGWGRRRYRTRERDVSKVRMQEVYDEKMSLTHWFDLDGQKLPLGEIGLSASEVLGGSEGWSYEQEVHEATGNEGATLERWYRRAVIVIWPPDRTFGILAREGQSAALPELERMAGASKKPEDLESCRDFARRIMACWKPRRSFARGQERFTQRMLTVLERIGTAELVRQFLRDVLPNDFDGSEGPSLVRLCERLGWEALTADLLALVARQKPRDDYSAPPTELGQIVSMCRPLFCGPPRLTAARRKACEALADELVRAIERWDGARKAWHQSERGRKGVVEGAIAMFAAIGSDDRLDWFAAYVIEDAKHYGLREVLAPDVKTIYSWLADVPDARPAAERLMRHCIAQLEEATERAPQPPADWKREAKLNCKCEDCRDLARFLHDPAARVGRFPLRKERRQHLHQQIDHHRLDCTHETERKGSPQTLVCTKTQASFERMQKQYHADRELLSELQAFADAKPPSTAKRKRARRAAEK